MRNYNDDDDDEMMKFSWVGMFAVTAACTFLFSLFLYLIDGENISTFFTVGGIAAVCACIAYLNKYHNRKVSKKRGQKMSHFFQQD